MSVNSSTFETIVPSRYITFTFPNDLPQPNHLLRIAVLDSPVTAATADVDASIATAAMWVPVGRESDWIFSTFSGHLHLLLSSPTCRPLSRLILISYAPLHSRLTSYTYTQHPSAQSNLIPLVLALTPKSAFPVNGEVPEVPFLSYEDEVVKGSILEICKGPRVGDMLIEDVELGNTTGIPEFRRRLRFKRMPNLVQTQIRIRPKTDLFCDKFDDVEFELDDDVLVHPYLSPMVAGISVISSCLERRLRDGFRLKALCLGIGGGALIGFLSKKLDFEVVGVEEDEVVLEVAKRYFGLESNELIHLCVGDGLEFLRKIAKNIDLDNKFDVIMVDLDSGDPTMGACAPPLEFVRKSVLLAARAALFELGILIINVIPSSESFYGKLVSEFQEVYEELYEIDVGNEENFVLIATKSKIKFLNTCDDRILNKLKLFVPRSYINSIRKISKTGDAQHSENSFFIDNHFS